MTASRKTSTVVFYQPDEDEVITRPGDQSYSESKIHATKLRTLGRKSTESSDSGVRSVTTEEDDGRRRSDDDGRRRSRRFSLRRFSRASVSSSPMFDFPTFDELFESGGKTKLLLHRSSTATSDVFPRSATSPSLETLGLRADALVTRWRQKQRNGSPSHEHAQEFSGDGIHGTCDGDIGSAIADSVQYTPWMTKLSGDGGSTSETLSIRLEEEMDVPSEKNDPPQLPQRQDTIMTLSLSALIYKSYDGSKGFAGFRNRLGNNVLHKYCMCCRFDSMPLVFLHVLLGMVIVCAGVLSLVHCFGEVWLNVYMLVDGLLSVFLFPILILNWTKRVGGCINENEKEKLGKGFFWVFTILSRLLLSVAGTMVLMYRNYYTEHVLSTRYCDIVNTTTFYIVFTEWAMVVVLLIIPMVIYGIVYFFAPCCYLEEEEESAE